VVRVKTNSPLPIVYLNGDFCRLEDASISVLDRGFLFGDGIYEIIPVYRGMPLQPDRHLARLSYGLNAISIEDPLGRDGWTSLITDLIARNGEADVAVYLQVTRGTPDYRDHAFPAHTKPTAFAMCTPLPELKPELTEKGIAAITRADNRWDRCDIKSISLLANVLLRQEAVNAGVAETILYDGDLIAEGSASSVFAVIGGKIITPPDGPEILPGTTRDLVLDLAAADDLTARFAEISRTQLAGADEIWLASSLRELLPVTLLDTRPVGTGKPGPVFRRVYQLYQEHKRRMPEQAA